MCGVFGLLKRNHNFDASKSLHSIRHRGPDDEGIHKDENVVLGFRRLSIIDLSERGHQPMSNEDSSVWLVFNGEIYNHKELRAQLSTAHNFKSDTDSEVLLHGYEEWGFQKLVSKLNGMFAFCLYDKKSQKLLLARDRIGKKPLYFYLKDDTFSFASEIKAFKGIDGVKFSIDPYMMDLFMGFPYLPDNNKTILNDVYKVAPGTLLEVSLGDGDNIDVKQCVYWDAKNIDVPKGSKLSFEDSVTKLDELLTDSVQKRLMADVPVGILLSGGLDSSLITALASKYSTSKIKTINISFKDSCIDETKYASITANHCKTEHTELVLDVPDAYEEFRKNIWIFDSLSTVDGGLFSEYLIAKKLYEAGVRVALVGEGADEVFGGYTWFQFSQYPFKFLPSYMRSLGYYYSIMRTLPTKQRFFKYGGIMNSLISNSSKDYFKNIQEFEIEYSLPNHYCMKVDKGMSAASMEARAPFLDYRIVEFANNLPSEYLLHGSMYSPGSINEKYILRKVAEKYLPKEIYARKKKGGMLPVNDILNTGLKKDRDTILSNEYLINYYGKEYLEKLIDSKSTNTLVLWEREWVLWKCLVFSIWYEYYVKN